ncbi:MAG: hypothetical protein NkDv07_0153 [Candidatus Improbicoccus devescovinae]|nr:MAG: hypothetical protein NkDv07_0153 [Candidatus Improbicoccus devescovinae]
MLSKIEADKQKLDVFFKELVKDEQKLKEFMSQKNMDELYKFVTSSLKCEIDRIFFDDYIQNNKSKLLKKKLSDDNISKISGGSIVSDMSSGSSQGSWIVKTIKDIFKI